MRVQAELACIQRAVLDAVVQGETHQVNVFDPAFLKVIGEAGVAAMRVVEERAVTVDVSLGALVKNMSDAAGVE